MPGPRRTHTPWRRTPVLRRPRPGHAQHLLAALRSRDVISVAKGRLIEQLGITAEDAFLLLVQGSQSSNTKLARVAEHVALSRSDQLRGCGRSQTR